VRAEAQAIVEYGEGAKVIRDDRTGALSVVASESSRPKTQEELDNEELARLEKEEEAEKAKRALAEKSKRGK
jgi:hypothetical protein